MVKRHETENRRNGVSASVSMMHFKISWRGKDIEILKDVPITYTRVINAEKGLFTRITAPPLQ